jgi:Zn-dependent protease with chaperone function
MIEEVKKQKWLAIYAFLIFDLIQILIVSILYLDESTLFVVGIDFSRTNPIASASLFFTIIALQVILIYLTAYRVLQQKDLVELYPTFNEPEGFRSRFSRDQIVMWTQELARKSKVNVSKIYLMNSALPNAFTFALPLMGSVVVVHTNTLEVLNEDEVKAIITHELGHIKNQDSIVQIFTRMPSFFIDIIYLYIYLRLALAVVNSVVASDIYSAGIRLFILVIFFLLSRLLTVISRLFMQKASRSAEFQCDYHAASILGSEATINALIRLGQRVEAITVLVEEIQWLESLNPERARPVEPAELMNMITKYPLDGIDEANAREVAPEVFLSTRLKNLREIYGVKLDDKQIEDAVEPAIPELRKKRNDVKPVSEATKKLETVDWRRVDYDSNRRLSKDELVDLLKLLRENPNKMLFDREVGVNMLVLDHPDFRRRVLFIADEFGL